MREEFRTEYNLVFPPRIVQRVTYRWVPAPIVVGDVTYRCLRPWADLHFVRLSDDTWRVEKPHPEGEAYQCFRELSYREWEILRGELRGPPERPREGLKDLYVPKQGIARKRWSR